MTTVEEILAAVRTLPADERSRLIPLLWDELADEDRVVLSPDWISEIQRRSEMVESGLMETDDWQSVRKRARRAAGLSE
jgi:putative addiction module component (TIGR02574 family)